MDVVLLKPVAKLGGEGEIVKVKPGYGRNYLIPQRLAILATPQQIRAYHELNRQRAEKKQRVRAQADQRKRQIESRSVTVKLTLGAGDKPFGSVTVQDVADALAAEGIKIEKRSIHLEEPIKSLGIYEVPIRLHPEVNATLKLWVVKA